MKIRVTNHIRASYIPFEGGGGNHWKSVIKMHL